MLRICVVALFISLQLTSCGAAKKSPNQSPMQLSNIKSDESVIFFPTAAWLDEEAQVWHLPVHAWVFEPEDSTLRKSVVKKLLEERYNLTVNNNNDAFFSERVNWLIADNERGKSVFVHIGDKSYELPPTQPDGHTRHTIQVTSKEIESLQDNGKVTFSAAAPGRVFSGVVKLIAPSGNSIISDIDDTVKISHVTDRRQLLDYTLLRAFEATPGIAKPYQKWAKDNVAIHYVSSSPWQLYPSLATFFQTTGLPVASFHLKSVRFRDKTLLNLFKKGTDTKPEQIEPILRKYPNRDFVLIGDTGEHDPEVYAKLMKQYPDQVRHILLRNVTEASADDTRFQRIFKGIDSDRWRLFSDAEELTQLGVFE